MKVLKGFATFLLTFLLFWSLTLFGLALVVNSTALNPGFVIRQLDRISISSLVEEAAKSGGGQGAGQPSEELLSAVVKTVGQIEPELKKQAGVAIHQVYDYLLGKKQNLSLATILGETVLSRDFVVSVVNNLDMAALTQQFINQQIAKQVPVSGQIGMEFLSANIGQAVVRLEPWMKEQVSAAAGPVLDYLLGKTQTLSVAVPVEPVMREIKEVAKGAFLASPPAEVAGFPRVAQELAFEAAFAGFTRNMPSTFVINEQMLGAEARVKIARGLGQAETRLAEAKVYVGYFQTAYVALIGFIILLVAFIVLIHRQVKPAARTLGVAFVTYGAIELAGVLVGKSVLGAELQRVQGPEQLRVFLPQLVGDFFGPLQAFTLGMLVLGVVLLVVSFVYKPRAASI